MQDYQSADRSSQSKDRNGALDLLRIAAALGVVFYHFLYRGALQGDYLAESYGAPADAVSLGYLGVNLFFLISGFVIIWSASGRDWYTFSIGRLARLYPAHLVAMTLTTLAMAWWAEPPFVADLGQWLANLTMLAPLFGQPFVDGAYWSIVLEVIFYLWVAIGLFTGVLPRHTDIAVAAWLGVIVVNNLIVGSGAVGLLLVTEYGAYFALGVMAWRLSAGGLTGFRVVLAGLATIMTFHSAEVQRLDVLAQLGEASTPQSVAIANAAILALFLLAVTLGRCVKAGPWVLALGGVSYPLYLIHQNAGYILIKLSAPHIGKWSAFALATAMSIGVSWWIYAHIEPPARRAIRGLFSPAARFLPRTGPRQSVPAE